MKLIIFGSTGTVGRHIVTQALKQGHAVTAFSRKPEVLDITHVNLTHATGDVLDAECVAKAVQGHEIVVCALGAGMKGTVRSVGTAHIIQAMERHGIRRLICQSTLGIGDSYGNLNFFWRYIMFGMLLRLAFADHVAQENLVVKSNLDWTIIRPGAFTDGPATGKYKHGFSAHETNLSLDISRADVAGFILKQLEDKTYLRQAPGLSY